MKDTLQPRYRWRLVALVVLILAPLAGLVILHDGPILQDRSYHAFADTRTGLGVRNIVNIASNLLFLLVGAAGLRWCYRHRDCGARRSWLAFFAGVALVFCGSAYYHQAPDDATLVWDRLPMSLGFAGLFAALLSEHLGEKLESALLAPALLAGVTSVLWWHWSGDLRPYIWIQAAPLLAIPYVVAAFPAQYTHRHYLLYGVGLYALAKVAEFHDREIYTLTAGWISGHSLKHLLAATAVCCVYFMLRRRGQSRTPVASSQ